MRCVPRVSNNKSRDVRSIVRVRVHCLISPREQASVSQGVAHGGACQRVTAATIVDVLTVAVIVPSCGASHWHQHALASRHHLSRHGPGLAQLQLVLSLTAHGDALADSLAQFVAVTS